MLRWAKTDLISETLQRRGFIIKGLRECVLRHIIPQNRDNFAAHDPTTKDDAEVISQLELNVLSLSMIVKVKLQEYELPTAEEKIF